MRARIHGGFALVAALTVSRAFAGFNMVPSSALQVAHVTLATAERFGITYQAYVLRRGEDDTNAVDFRFPKLSESEFVNLRLAYGGMSQVRYRADRMYWLTDFLPPQMQALSGTRFVEEWHSSLASIIANCWGTTYEVARGGQSFVVFYGSGFAMHNILTDDRFSTLVGKTKPARGRRIEIGALQDGLEFGDVLIISRHGSMIHAMTYVDRNIFFEMPGIDSELSFGLRWRSAPLRSGDVAEARRFRGNGNLPLPHPRQAFSGAFGFAPLVYAELPILIDIRPDNQGRGILPEESFGSIIGGKFAGISLERSWPTRVGRGVVHACRSIRSAVMRRE